MIQSILVYTQEGRTIYAWESRPGSLSYTNKILVPGFFSAINTIVGDIFQGRLQRIVLEDKTIVLSGKKSFIGNENQWILISLTVDLQDNNMLIDSLINKLMDMIFKKINLEKENLAVDKDLDNEIELFLQKKIFYRTSEKKILSIFAVFISIFMTSLAYSLIRSQKNGLDNSNVVSFSVAVIIGLILIIPSSSLAGSKILSSIVGIIPSCIGSIFSYWFINQFLVSSNFFGGLGGIYVYISFCSLLGFCSGFIGGFILDRYYLY